MHDSGGVQMHPALLHPLPAAGQLAPAVTGCVRQEAMLTIGSDYTQNLHVADGLQPREDGMDRVWVRTCGQDTTAARLPWVCILACRMYKHAYTFTH